jgi:hypothetical protein
MNVVVVGTVPECDLSYTSVKALTTPGKRSAQPDSTPLAAMIASCMDRQGIQPVFHSSWCSTRRRLGLRAGAGAAYAAAFTPLLAVVTVLPGAAAAYVAAEVVWLGLTVWRRRVLAAVSPAPPLDPQLAQQAMEEVKMGVEALSMSPSAWLSSWARGTAPPSPQATEQLVASALWCASPDTVAAAGHGPALKRMVAELMHWAQAHQHSPQRGDSAASLLAAGSEVRVLLRWVLHRPNGLDFSNAASMSREAADLATWCAAALA